MFDFGGVITSSPFEAFTRYEQAAGLPDGFIRLVNSTDPDGNAWSRLERGQLDVDGFAAAFEAEALRLGQRVDGRAVLGLLGGAVRPAMVEAVRRCTEQFETACLTNNFTLEDAPVPPEVSAIFELFDVVVESRVVGIRKPEPRFYELACRMVGVAPDEVVYLDDLGINLKPARAMGMTTIKVSDPGAALGELSAATGLTFGEAERADELNTGRRPRPPAPPWPPVVAGRGGEAGRPVGAHAPHSCPRLTPWMGTGAGRWPGAGADRCPPVGAVWTVPAAWSVWPARPAWAAWAAWGPRGARGRPTPRCPPAVGG